MTRPAFRPALFLSAAVFAVTILPGCAARGNAQAVVPGPTPGPAGNVPAPHPSLAGPCDAARIAPLVGEIRSEETGRRALELSHARSLRWIAPGMAVTMDYRSDRLNLDIDDRGRITGGHCG